MYHVYTGDHQSAKLRFSLFHTLKALTNLRIGTLKIPKGSRLKAKKPKKKKNKKKKKKKRGVNARARRSENSVSSKWNWQNSNYRNHLKDQSLYDSIFTPYSKRTKVSRKSRVSKQSLFFSVLIITDFLALQRQSRRRPQIADQPAQSKEIVQMDASKTDHDSKRVETRKKRYIFAFFNIYDVIMTQTRGHSTRETLSTIMQWLNWQKMLAMIICVSPFHPICRSSQVAFISGELTWVVTSPKKMYALKKKRQTLID